MTSEDTISFISKRLNLKSKQVDALRQLPDIYWRKCSQAINIAKHKGYHLDLVMDGLIKNKPDPKVEFIHTYDIHHKTKEYLHTINIKITI